MNRQKKDAQPGWANGLRQLYDSVVEEELPDSFKDLLSKLDGKN
ncbi:MAG TPA: NepR family anti-sigma factor [Tsuneonella suprasediminis]|nr:NepR family anti-sigma factor [Tsuneonella flava]